MKMQDTMTPVCEVQQTELRLRLRIWVLHLTQAGWYVSLVYH